jgi:hypothetical protein
MFTLMRQGKRTDPLMDALVGFNPEHIAAAAVEYGPDLQKLELELAPGPGRWVKDTASMSDRYPPVEWRVAEREMVDALRNLFREKNITGIKVVYSP